MARQAQENEHLQLEEVTKLYQSGQSVVTALDKINLLITAGEFVVLMGKSGSGKSTLLHLMGGLDWPSSGRVSWNGKDLSSYSRNELAEWRGKHVGFIFQTFNLIPTLSAQENVELPLLLAGVALKERRARAEELIAKVELSARADKKPATLSGGEQQRVAIARALAADPDLILADEPTGNLDSESAAVILDLLIKLHQQGKTIILATHDTTGAARASRILHLSAGIFAKSPSD